MTIKTVGVIGLGKMGGPLAKHLTGAKYDVIGYDVSEAVLQKLEPSDILIANSCADVAEKCDLVIVGVGFDSEVEEVIFGDTGLLVGATNKTIIAVASTIAPQTMKDIATRSANRNAAFLDIPMTRGEQAAIDLGLNNIHPDIMKLLGRLKFRTSYTQNVLEHVKEVSWVCGVMAAELGLDEMVKSAWEWQKRLTSEGK